MTPMSMQQPSGIILSFTRRTPAILEAVHRLPLNETQGIISISDSALMSLTDEGKIQAE